MKLWVLVVVGLAVVFAFVLLPSEPGERDSVVCFERDCFVVEVASTPAERAEGLMWRSELGEREGMLFVFEEDGQHGFWMKNTLIPLDIVWLAESGEVVDIATLEPCDEVVCDSYAPSAAARYVLEVNAGMMEEIGVSVGDLGVVVVR